MRTRTWGLLACVGLLGCANTVPQDRSTGPDGKLKGATPVALQDGEAKVRGVVTYPGGDRVDWRRIEIPGGQRGQLDLQLSWRAPRPGLKVAFDVFDQYNAPVAGRTRTATINDAVGTYFVRIYAPRRGDAGAYTLKASFTQNEIKTGVDPRTMPIPEPPRLAAVPPPEPTCDSFDASNKACRTVCPFDAPDGWPGCRPRDDAKAAADKAAADAAVRDACLKNAPKSAKAKVIHVEVKSEGVQVKLDKGTDDRPTLGTDWTATVLDDAGKPLANGKVQIRGVTNDQTRGMSSLTLDQLTRHQYVRLDPPAPNC